MMARETTTAIVAVAADRYGGPERLRLVTSIPTPPGAGQVQIETHAVALNRSDLLAIRGEPFFMRLGNGLTRPRHAIPGSDLAGRIVDVGAGVDRFVPGDPVVVDLSDHGRGGLAQRVTVDAKVVVPVPARVSLEAAAALPTAGVTAFQALKTVADLRPGERILIDGASGGVGGFAIQVARVLGAHVTAVVGSRKAEFAIALGAHEAVDYTQSDPTEPRQDDSSGTDPHRYDVIYVVNGHRSLSSYQRILAPEGRFVMTGGSGSLMLQTMLGGRRYHFHTMKPNPPDLALLLQLAASGQIVPNIVARYPLTRAVEALTQLEQGHAAGKIIISMDRGE